MPISSYVFIVQGMLLCDEKDAFPAFDYRIIQRKKDIPGAESFPPGSVDMPYFENKLFTSILLLPFHTL